MKPFDVYQYVAYRYDFMDRSRLFFFSNTFLPMMRSTSRRGTAANLLSVIFKFYVTYYIIHEIICLLKQCWPTLSNGNSLFNIYWILLTKNINLFLFVSVILAIFSIWYVVWILHMSYSLCDVDPKVFVSYLVLLWQSIERI